MRATNIVVLGLCALAGCDAGTRSCKSGTLFVSFTVEGSPSVDTLGVEVAVGSGSPRQGSYPLSAASKGSLEIDFPGGYPKGQSVSVTLQAKKGDTVLAQATGAVTLTAGCEALHLDLQPGSVADLAGSDGSANVDLSTSDLLMTPKAVILATPDLVGFVTKLDGTGSTDPKGGTLSYAWHFTAVPPGSAITDIAFMPSANVSKVSFDPDFGGTYSVQLTVTAADGMGTTVSDVVVPTIPIYYMEITTVDGGDGLLKMGSVRSDGTGAHPIICNTMPDGGVLTEYRNTPVGTQVGILDFADLIRGRYPAPPASSVVVFSKLSGQVGSPTGELFLGDDSFSCGGSTSPLQLDKLDTFSDGHLHAWPRFSPDGTRVAYLDFQFSGGGGARVVTVGADGTDLRRVRSAVASPSPQVQPIPPAWIDNSHLAWVEQDPSNPKPYLIVTSSDASLAGDSNTSPADRAQVRACDSSVAGNFFNIMQIEPIAGTFLINAETAPSTLSKRGSIGLYKMGPDCSASDATVIYKPPVFGRSWNFELSPDKLTLLFASTQDDIYKQDGSSAPTLPDDIYLMPSDGSGMPVKLGGAPGVFDYSPQFVAGGRQVIWMQLDPFGESDLGPTAGGLHLINVDGTHERVLYANHQIDHNSAVGVGVGTNSGLSNTCDWVAGAAPVGSGFAAAVGLLIFLVLSRRRQS